jgi:hypothetical protein
MAGYTLWRGALQPDESGIDARHDRFGRPTKLLEPLRFPASRKVLELKLPDPAAVFRWSMIGG